jgi:DNA topoisomerase-1
MARSGRKLVIVESPTKAKTIRKFLGKDYIVESCMGHVRDLPQSAKDIPAKFKKQPWATLGVNVDNDFEPIYCVPKNKEKVVKALKEKLEQADELILATDEDREGESISWHLVELLKPGVPFKRMVFHEITKEAIHSALNEFREIDSNLVRAQEARRILDRLVGYTLSPLLWKKIAYGLSAGRVQSVAVRLIVEREKERLRFKPTEYSSLVAQFKKTGDAFEGRLFDLSQKRVATGKDFDGLTGKLAEDKLTSHVHLNHMKAMDTKAELQDVKPYKVISVEEKPISRKPAPPFITSTLQQEANRKLGMSSRETMQVAQSLYEQGIITYMRTDSTFLSNQALEAARSCIAKKYGKNYLPPEARSYAGKKVKGAQEAHEAIRPAGTEFIDPDETGLKGREFALYDLIWKRTVASQMVNAQQKQVSIRIQAADKPAVFASSGMTIEFPGFLRAYVEGRDDAEAALEEREVILPTMKVGDTVDLAKLEVQDHETKPPARYTEASLVQTMEREGIGRPSTYASIIGTIIDRGYVRKAANALCPTFTAMAVSELLAKKLPQYVDLKFTSEMEKSLDEVADGDLDSYKYLHTIYFGPTGLKDQVAQQETKINAEEAREIQLSGLEDLSFRVGRYGAYVCKKAAGGEEVCASIPDDQAPGEMTRERALKLIDQKINGSDALGKDPKTGLPVYVLSGRYGPYVQLGDVDGDDAKPKRASLPPGVEPEKVTLQTALDLLSLPKTLGAHPDSSKDIKVGLGRFGPYVVHDGDFRSIPKTESLFTISFERALELLREPKKGRGRGSTALKNLGPHPENNQPVDVMDGKYGPYVKWGSKNVTLPENLKPDTVTLEQALQLIEEKFGKGKGKKAKASGESAAARKASAKANGGAAKTTKPKGKAASKAAKEPEKPIKPPPKVLTRKAVNPKVAG